MYRPVVAQFRNHGVAVLATMVAIAVWHEFSGRYLVWAAYHAAGLVVHRRFRAWRDASAGTAAPNPLAVLLSKSATIVFVMLGFTKSADYPVTSGAFDETYNGNAVTCCGGDYFVTRLNPSLAGPAQLIASTYLGGGHNEFGSHRLHF